MTSPWLAFALAAAAASATLLGWAIAASRRTWPPKVFGVVLLLAAAAMVLISGLELLPTAMRAGQSIGITVLWVGVGAGIVVAMHLVADRLGLGGNKLGRSALLVAVAIGLHNIPEGAAPVAAALLSWQAGVVTAVAVGLHNIPEGIAVAAPVMASGGTRAKAFRFTLIATGGEILGAALALLFAEALTPTNTSALLTLVAGIMISLSLVELLPGGIALMRRTAEEEQARVNTGLGL